MPLRGGEVDTYERMVGRMGRLALTSGTVTASDEGPGVLRLEHAGGGAEEGGCMMRHTVQ